MIERDAGVLPYSSSPTPHTALISLSPSPPSFCSLFLSLSLSLLPLPVPLPSIINLHLYLSVSPASHPPSFPDSHARSLSFTLMHFPDRWCTKEEKGWGFAREKEARIKDLDSNTNSQEVEGSTKDYGGEEKNIITTGRADMRREKETRTQVCLTITKAAREM